MVNYTPDFSKDTKELIESEYTVTLNVNTAMAYIVVKKQMDRTVSLSDLNSLIRIDLRSALDRYADFLDRQAYCYHENIPFGEGYIEILAHTDDRCQQLIDRMLPNDAMPGVILNHTDDGLIICRVDYPLQISEERARLLISEFAVTRGLAFDPDCLHMVAGPESTIFYTGVESCASCELDAMEAMDNQDDQNDICNECGSLLDDDLLIDRHQLLADLREQKRQLEVAAHYGSIGKSNLEPVAKALELNLQMVADVDLDQQIARKVERQEVGPSPPPRPLSGVVCAWCFSEADGSDTNMPVSHGICDYHAALQEAELGRYN